MSSKELSLAVNNDKVIEGSEIHFYKHKLDDKHQWWVLNSDTTLSPEINLNLVIGWQGEGQIPILVHRSSPNKAQFTGTVTNALRRLQ
jgi:hypothetical protein